MIFVLEGIDRSGKSTLCKLIKKSVKNVVIFHFPDRKTEVGKIIDKVLKKKIILDPLVLEMLFNVNKHEKLKEIIEAVENKKIVVIDRWVLSEICYGTHLENNFAKILVQHLISRLKVTENGTFRNIKLITLFLNFKPDETILRTDFGLEKFEKKEIQEKIYYKYIEKIQDYSDEYHFFKGDIEQNLKDILFVINHHVNSR